MIENKINFIGDYIECITSYSGHMLDESVIDDIKTSHSYIIGKKEEYIDDFSNAQIYTIVTTFKNHH